MKTSALFGLIIVIVVMLFAAYDALKNRKQTEWVSLTWHGIKYFLLLGISGYVYYTFYGFTWEGVEPAIWTAIATWWVFDLTYNFVSGKQWHYAGDGKGSFLERVVGWVSKKLKLHNSIVLHFMKLIVTIVYFFVTK